MDFYTVSDKQPLSGEDVSSRQSLHRDASGVEALIEPTQQVVEESMVKVCCHSSLHSLRPHSEVECTMVEC